MRAWVSDGGRFGCRWVEVGQRSACASQYLKDAMTGSYLPPPPDFASHSPFGGATWFTSHLSFPQDSY